MLIVGLLTSGSPAVTIRTARQDHTMKEYKRGHITLNPGEVSVTREGTEAPPPHSPHVSGGAPVHERGTACVSTLDPLTDVSVIIVNWNTKKLLHACLMSLHNNATSVRVET